MPELTPVPKKHVKKIELAAGMWAGWLRPAGGHVLEEDPHQAAGRGGRPPPTALHQQAATRLLRQPEDPAFRYQYTDRTHQEIYRYWATNFFSLIVFGGTEVHIIYILLCSPSEDSLQESVVPDGSPSKDWQSTVGWGDCWILTQDCSFTIWCHYQWATTAPKTEPSLLPLEPLKPYLADFSTMFIAWKTNWRRGA